MPLRIAIVGAGPCGLVSATRIGTAARDSDVAIDLFDARICPPGLLRFGLDCGACPARFFGNVVVGRDLSTTDLAETYAATIDSSAGASACRRTTSAVIAALIRGALVDPAGGTDIADLLRSRSIAATSWHAPAPQTGGAEMPRTGDAAGTTAVGHAARLRGVEEWARTARTAHGIPVCI